MAVRALMRERFKGRGESVPTTVSVATTVTDILKNDPDRFSWIITNLSANRGFLWFDREVSSSRGIPIEASGGVVSTVWEEDGELTTYAVFGINEVAAGTWSIVENGVG